MIESALRAAELLATPRVAPSILAADFGRLAAQVEEVMEAGARVIHVDVMDGHFVPPITIGALVVDALKEPVARRGGILDVHLMIERPERRAAEFARAGADVITIHLEATPHAHRALSTVREAGCLAGLALNPATPAGAVEAAVHAADLLLCMSVDPGWGGQPFIAGTLAKLRRLRDLAGAGIALEVDGGVAEDNADACRAAGATVLVAGSAVFAAADPAAAYQAIAAAAGAT